MKEKEISELQAELIYELIKTRKKRRFSQKELEIRSGVRQPIIARIEKQRTVPRVDTMMKILRPFGKTLAIVSIKNDEYL